MDTTSTLLLCSFVSILYLTVKFVKTKYLEKQSISKDNLKIWFKDSLIISFSVFISTKVLDYIQPSLLTVDKPGVIISDPEF